MKYRSKPFESYLQIALLLLAVFAPYARSLHAAFVFDDREFFKP